MKEKKNEISFYPAVCELFKKHLEEYLPRGFKVATSYNKSLPQMVKEVAEELKGKTLLSDGFVPSLKLDILFGIRKLSGDISLLLLEVKYDKSLSLSNFSQLAGYLQVAKGIGVGILLLIDKSPDSDSLSNDFSDILRMNSLPLDWEVVLKRINGTSYNFRVGIATYFPNNGLDWIDTRNVDGISSFEELVSHLLK